MKGSKKVLLIISAMLLLLVLANTIIVSVIYRNAAQQQEITKAKTIAALVEDGLTAHMLAGTMDKRKIFLDNVKISSKAEKIWIFRSNKVVKQYGKGFRNESIKDYIDKKTIETGETQQVITENINKALLRLTIPYKISQESQPNCLKCHTNAKVGDVLGGISLEFNLDEKRFAGILTIIKILGFTLIAMIIFLYITNKLIKPYVNSLSLIQEALIKLDKGYYSVRIKLNGDNESNIVYKWLNFHFEKLEKTIGAIEDNLSLFVADRRKKFHDPLEKSQFIIEDIAMLYKFKKTIEHDKSKDIIYHRLIKIFKEELHVADLSFYEVNVKENKRTIIYDDTPDKFCTIADDDVNEHCRAYRTQSVVMSDDFTNICQVCSTHKEYLCISYPIDDNVALILNIKPENRNELHENKKAIGYIKNYLESARPVLQSKILTEILQKSNMIDGLTNLYNRKYLNNFMENEVLKYDSFSVAMLDIDFFKKVNDTYGHDAGDSVLKGLSKIFKNEIGQNDIAFRFGGEEFLIFMPNIDNAVETIEKIRITFEKTIFHLKSEELIKTLSSGISFYPKDSSSIWQVIKCADLALYEAKNSGRNRTILYKDIKDKG